MPHYEIKETDLFLKDLEEISFWILVTNIEHSQALAESKLNQLESDLAVLKNKIRNFPESGEENTVRGVRQFPIYDGRYSLRWVVDHSKKAVTLISLFDSRYPKKLRNIQTDE